MYCNYLLYIVFIILFILIFFIIDKKYCEQFADVAKPSSSKPSFSIDSPLSILKSTIRTEYNLDSESIRNLSNLSSKIYNNNNLTIPGNLKILGKLNIFPVGQISAYTGTTDPIGWLICDGRSLPINQYLNLYNILNISSSSNLSSSSNTMFNIPDYRGLFLKGATNNNLNKYNKDCIQDHTHKLTGIHSHNINFIRKHILNCPDDEHIANSDYHICFEEGTREKKNMANEAEAIGMTVTTDANAQTRGDILKGRDYLITFTESKTNVTFSKITSLDSTYPQNVNVSKETRPYNWTINWIIKY